MDSSNSDIHAKVLHSLKGTPYACDTLTELGGGFVNWTYLGSLSQPLEDGTKQVIIKHGETHMKAVPDFRLEMDRCALELAMLEALSVSSVVGTTAPQRGEAGGAGFAVRSPKAYDWDSANTNQITEYFAEATNLKAYLEAQRSSLTQSQGHRMGRALGSWLRCFHEWGAQQAAELKDKAATWGVFGQQVKLQTSFGWFTDRIEAYPEQLGDAKNVLLEVQSAMNAEWADTSGSQIIHGDFGLGNILIRDGPALEDAVVPLRIIDWELAHLGRRNTDLGQILGELFAVWRILDIPAGLWVMQGVVAEYGEFSVASVFRTALHLGAHQITITADPGHTKVGEPETAVALGRGIVLHAWRKDRKWFEEEGLGFLFSHVND